MSSATEAKLGTLFINTKVAVPIWKTLEELGHPQIKTIQTDNLTAYGAINNTIQPKVTNAMDMHFHWLRDRMIQVHFWFFWRPGATNLGNYWTKHHTSAHHIRFCQETLMSKKYVDAFKQLITIGDPGWLPNLSKTLLPSNPPKKTRTWHSV